MSPHSRVDAADSERASRLREAQSLPAAVYVREDKVVDRVATYRAALEAGADPRVVTGWIAEVTAERQRHEIERSRSEGQTRLSRNQIATLVDQLTTITALLKNADPRDRAEVYAQLGLRLTYDDTKHLGVLRVAQQPSRQTHQRGAAGDDVLLEVQLVRHRLRRRVSHGHHRP
jgi:site-specific DNA recombinase